MTIEFEKDGTEIWHFYRKCYKKARWRRVGQRMLNYERKTDPGCHGLIVVI